MDLTKFSKTMAHALRHAPESYGISLDQDGWASVGDLLQGIVDNTTLEPTLEDIKAVLAMPGKRRYEMVDNKIRAYNGHSTKQKVQQEEAIPPDTLYHGTVEDAMDGIKKSGLNPMSRQYVHLSADRETAISVANRRRSDNIILKVAARMAHDEGVKFYRGVDGIWMADHVPVKYLYR